MTDSAEKVFLGDDQKFLRTADAVRTQRYEGTTTFHPKTTTELRMGENQLLRDFRRRSIFDFCNPIGTFRT